MTEGGDETDAFDLDDLSPDKGFEDLEIDIDEEIDIADEIALDNDGPPSPYERLTHEPLHSFDDVAGYRSLRDRLRERFVDPEGTVPEGILFHGPPGVGKTHLVGALADALGLVVVVVGPGRNDASPTLRDRLTAAADPEASTDPCLLHIHEFGSQGSGAAVWPRDRLDSLAGGEVVVVGETVDPERVPDRLRGWFDEWVEVPPPDADDRVHILRHHLDERPVASDGIDWDAVAEATEGFVAGDLALLATEAAREALDDIGEDGGVQPITQGYIDRAIDGIEPTTRGESTA
jgi:SpoVK/Ycf46/Vps4 family AAA+-type ATPase